MGAGSGPHVPFMDEFDDARGRIPASNVVADNEACSWWHQSAKQGKPDDK
jgi:hypothetical protein